MKAPEKSQPNEQATFSGEGAAAPSIQVTEAHSASSASSAGEGPTQDPPASSSSGDQSYGAAVWASDKRVNALYHTKDARNSWMSITGTGWVKLTTVSDSASEAMTILAAHARTKNCRLDYATDGGVTTEIYVW